MSVIMPAQGTSSTFLPISISTVKWKISASQINVGNYGRNKSELYKVFEVLLLKFLYV